MGDFSSFEAFSKYLSFRGTFLLQWSYPKSFSIILFFFAVLQGCLLDVIYRCKKRPSMSHFLSKISLATSSGIIDLQGIPYYRRPSLLCKIITSKNWIMDMLRIRFELLKSSKYSSRIIIKSEWCYLLSSFLKIIP